MALPDPLPIEPIEGFDACVRPPGSKSLTNRALLLGALSSGQSRLQDVLLADDTRVMIAGLQQLGFALEVDEATCCVTVDGCDGRLPAATADVSLGNAGTAVRFLTAACCLGPGPYGLDGVPRMRQRPIDQLVGPLRELGAEIDYVERAGCPPLRVRGGTFTGGSVAIGPTLSSQYISALLQVGPCCPKGIELCFAGPITSFPYVAMTLGLMLRFGAEVVLEEDWSRVRVEGGGGYQACMCPIEPDASNASYFLAAAAISPSSRCVVEGLGTDSLQGDADFARVLESMGAQVQREPNRIVVVGPDRLRGIDVDLNRMPDMAQTLAVVALFAEGPTVIRRIGNLRVKETDRLAALESELTKLGAAVHIDADDLQVEMATPGRLRPADIRTYDDHRMAMSFAVAGLRSGGIRIQDPTCVNKTFPGFWDHLQALGRSPASSK
ncbi:MAG: 3-phosphoshikimate 1-carboxyvinyltransferase [Phycisphaerae bacterium]|nr:3-phosphoshikimate 1-carboxyvinyltransferase [Phycisphaerae bacterium]